MKTLRNIGLIFVISLLILATGGVSIFHHVCHCAGEMSSSIFTEASCHHEHQSKSCCSAKETASCCLGKTEKEPAHKGHDKDCCQNSLQFIKINDSFQPGEIKINLKPDQVITPLVLVDFQEDIHQPSILNINSSDLPPPETGRQIVVSLHQLKLDTHLV